MALNFVIYHKKILKICVKYTKNTVYMYTMQAYKYKYTCIQQRVYLYTQHNNVYNQVNVYMNTFNRILVYICIYIHMLALIHCE